ncbi:MAG: family phosphohydrolase, partial [Thermoleophilia bacterium]|nr:family phosphohydrolase [Thermoleophilia bacterium]
MRAGTFADGAHVSSPAQSANEAQAPPAWRNAALASAFAVAAIAISVVVLRDASAGAGALFAASFAMFAAASTRFEVEMKFVAFGGDVVPLVAAIVLAPRYAPLVALSCAVAEYPSWRSRVGNTATFVVAAGAAVLVIGAVGAESMLTAGDVATNTVFAIGSFLLVNVGLSLLMVLVAQVVSLPDLVRMLAGSLLATMTFASPLVFAVVYATIHLGLGALPLVLAPIAMCQYFLSLYTRKVQLTEELAEKAQILARTNLQFAAAMVRALDTRDAYTAGHSAAVAVYTRDIAREMGFDDETVRLAHLAGLLHDIGKIGVPGRVLNKTAPLDDEEYELMKTHAAMGADILGEVDLYKDIAVMVRYHHERMDGRGYPDQLEGEAIPAISRMISVADTYSAMTTDRPYREG